MRVTKIAVLAHGLLLLVTLFAAAIGVAAAEPAKPVTGSKFESCQAATLTLQAPTPLWEQALQEIDRCQQDTAYLTAAARWLNEQRRYEEGQLYAERALLLDPVYIPAWIEFALSQTALGSPEAGIQALLQAREEARAQLVITSDRLTPDTAQAIHVTRLTQWVSEIDDLLRHRSQPVPRTPARTWNAFVGYDSNFHGAPSVSQFELTLPTGPVLLPIPTDLAPQKGLQTGLDITQSGGIQGSQLWQYTLQAQVRALVGHSSDRIVSIQVNAERFDRVARGQFVNMGVAASYIGPKLAISQMQGAFGRELVSPWNCNLRMGAEVQLRHYPQSASLDGNYIGLLHEGVCASGWTWQTRLGQDRPTTPAERSGGIQQQIGLQLRKIYHLDDQKALQAEMNVWRQTDQKGYSALLSNNALRRINRGTLRLEYQWNLKNRHVPYVALERTVQRSNLSLFKSQSAVVQFGVRGVW